MKTPTDQMMDTVQWSETGVSAPGDGMAYATHQGVLDLFGTKMRVYRLSTGQAVIDADDMAAFRLLWKITARNWMGWPTERRHRLTGKVQHIRYNESGKWQDGPLQGAGGSNER